MFRVGTILTSVEVLISSVEILIFGEYGVRIVASISSLCSMLSSSLLVLLAASRIQGPLTPAGGGREDRGLGDSDLAGTDPRFLVGRRASAGLSWVMSCPVSRSLMFFF